MEDPIERLKEVGRERGLEVSLTDEPVPDLSEKITFVPDNGGVFPKTIKITLQSTGELIEEAVIDKGGRFHFKIPESGVYILDMRPLYYEELNVTLIDPEEDPHVSEQPDYRGPLPG